MEKSTAPRPLALSLGQLGGRAPVEDWAYRSSSWAYRLVDGNRVNVSRFQE